MQNFFLRYLVSIALVTFLLPAFVSAESARSYVESGNEAFGQGDFATSLKEYEKAAASEPNSAIVLFNKGDALYKQEKFADALNVFEQAAARALENNDEKLEALSRYNMGNSSYRKAEAISRENPAMALEEYTRSSGYFKSAVKLNPNLSEAVHNLEVSRMAAKQMEDLIRQQQQQARQRQEQRQEIAKELEKLQREQQQAAVQSRNLAQAQEKKDAGHEAAQQAQDQKSITDRTKEAGEKLGQIDHEQNAQAPVERAGEQVAKAVEKQEEAERNLQENRPEAAHENQQDAARELQKAMRQLAQGQGEEQKNKDTGQEQESQKAEAEQNKQQAAAEKGEEAGSRAQSAAGTFSGVSPEDIINEEIENRKYRSTSGAAGYTPVDKDW